MISQVRMFSLLISGGTVHCIFDPDASDLGKDLSV